MDKTKFVMNYLNSHVNLLYNKALSEHRTHQKCQPGIAEVKQRSHSVTSLKDQRSNCVIYPVQKIPNTVSGPRNKTISHTPQLKPDNRVISKSDHNLKFENLLPESSFRTHVTEFKSTNSENINIALSRNSGRGSYSGHFCDRSNDILMKFSGKNHRGSLCVSKVQERSSNAKDYNSYKKISREIDMVRRNQLSIDDSSQHAVHSISNVMMIGDPPVRNNGKILVNTVLEGSSDHSSGENTLKGKTLSLGRSSSSLSLSEDNGSVKSNNKCLETCVPKPAQKTVSNYESSSSEFGDLGKMRWYQYDIARSTSKIQPAYEKRQHPMIQEKETNVEDISLPEEDFVLPADNLIVTSNLSTNDLTLTSTVNSLNTVEKLALTSPVEDLTLTSHEETLTQTVIDFTSYVEDLTLTQSECKVLQGKN